LLFIFRRKEKRGQDQWLRPVIPATREAEIWRIMFEARLGKKLVKLLSQPTSQMR
jgi:hypothetical protein